MCSSNDHRPTVGRVASAVCVGGIRASSLGGWEVPGLHTRPAPAQVAAMS